MLQGFIPTTNLEQRTLYFKITDPTVMHLMTAVFNPN